MELIVIRCVHSGKPAGLMYQQADLQRTGLGWLCVPSGSGAIIGLDSLAVVRWGIRGVVTLVAAGGQSKHHGRGHEQRKDPFFHCSNSSSRILAENPALS